MALRKLYVHVRTHTNTKKPRQDQRPRSLQELQPKHNLECPAERDEFRRTPSQAEAEPRLPAVKEKEEPESAGK
jgi:hypothetical protein